MSPSVALLIACVVALSLHHPHFYVFVVVHVMLILFLFMFVPSTIFLVRSVILVSQCIFSVFRLCAFLLWIASAFDGRVFSISVSASCFRCILFSVVFHRFVINAWLRMFFLFRHVIVFSSRVLSALVPFARLVFIEGVFIISF